MISASPWYIRALRGDDRSSDRGVPTRGDSHSRSAGDPTRCSGPAECLRVGVWAASDGVRLKLSALRKLWWAALGLGTAGLDATNNLTHAAKPLAIEDRIWNPASIARTLRLFS